MKGEFAEWLAEMAQIGLARGIAGIRDDELAFTREWGFDVADASKVTVWHGTEDRFVPYAHGLWLASHIPGARRRLLDDEGHLSIAVKFFDRILDDLLDPT